MRSDQRRGDALPSVKAAAARRSSPSRARAEGFSSGGGSCRAPRSACRSMAAPQRCPMSCASAARCGAGGALKNGERSHSPKAALSTSSPASSASPVSAASGSGCCARGSPPSIPTSARAPSALPSTRGASRAAAMSEARRVRAPAAPGSITSRRASGCALSCATHQALMASSSACASAGRSTWGDAPWSEGPAAATVPSAPMRGGSASKPASSGAAARSGSCAASLARQLVTLAAPSSRQRASRSPRASRKRRASPSSAAPTGMSQRAASSPARPSASPRAPVSSRSRPRAASAAAARHRAHSSVFESRRGHSSGARAARRSHSRRAKACGVRTSGLSHTRWPSRRAAAACASCTARRRWRVGTRSVPPDPRCSVRSGGRLNKCAGQVSFAKGHLKRPLTTLASFTAAGAGAPSA
jgi:hypothetical protein